MFLVVLDIIQDFPGFKDKAKGKNIPSLEMLKNA